MLLGLFLIVEVLYWIYVFAFFSDVWLSVLADLSNLILNELILLPTPDILCTLIGEFTLQIRQDCV